jgi:uncharacterized protein (TIGR03067 family)
MKTTIVFAFLIAAAAGLSAAAQDQKKEVAKFAGTWELDELIYNGEDHTKLKFKVTFKGSEAVIEGNDAVKREYARIKLKLDPSTMPKIVDVKVSAGSQADATMEGIYEFKDGKLRMCVKVFGKDRPSEFAAPGGSSCVLMVLKRAAQ